MTFAAAVPMAIQALGSIGSGFLANKAARYQTPIQKKQAQVIDQLLASLNGQGPYSDLFNTDEAAFQKGIVDPSMARFRNQIIPQIQQGFIQSGQQRGTGLEDTLTRAGVDMSQLINEQYLPFKQKGQDRMSEVLNSILGMGAGSFNRPSNTQALGESAAGYFSSPDFQGGLADLLKAYQNRPMASNAPRQLQRRGYEGSNTLSLGSF